MSQLTDRIEDTYAWLENVTGNTLNRVDIEEVAALESNYAVAIEANVAVAKRNADLITENAGMELMMQEGEGFYDGLEGKYAALEAKLSKMEELKTYAMLLEGKVSLDLLDWLLKTRRLLGLEKEMANWLIPDEHREALAAEEDLSTLPTQQKLTEEDMERN